MHVSVRLVFPVYATPVAENNVHTLITHASFEISETNQDFWELIVCHSCFDGTNQDFEELRNSKHDSFERKIYIFSTQSIKLLLFRI